MDSRSMRAFDEVSHLMRCRNADGVGQNDFGGRKSRSKLRDRARIDTPFERTAERDADRQGHGDRKSTRLNSSHPSISYAVFCLKKKRGYLVKRLLGYKGKWLKR